MQNCENLFGYGYLVILLAGGLIVIPYWRGKTELISAWNILLCGIALFIGIGAIEAALSPMRFKGVQWFEPTRAQVSWWVTATTIFLVTLVATHYYDPVSRSLAARCFNKWPPLTTSLILFIVFFCLGLAIAARIPFLTRITFFGPIVVNVSHKAMVFACVFSFLLWFENRLNLVWLGVFVGVLLTTCFLAILASGGRRLVLSIFVAPVLVFYFYHARHWRPAKSMGVIAIAILGIFILSLIYSTIRHFDRRGELSKQRDRSAARALEAVKNIDRTAWLKNFTGDSLWALSQHVVHYGMLTDHYVATGQLEAQPFNTFKFMLVYPIPRRIWREKPESLGRIITHKVLSRQTTWGTGIAGHAAFEGGLIIAAMFGYMAAFGVRFFDDPLRRQPKNPFLIAMLGAAAMHLVGWPRGDLSVMTFEIVECFFFTIALAFLGRFLFGTDRSRVAGRVAVPRGRVVYQAHALGELVHSSPAPSITQHRPQSAQKLPDADRALWVLGPLPPPVTGMTLMTSAILKSLQSGGDVRYYNWSPGMPRRSLWMRLRRNARMLRSIMMLLARGRVRNQRLYLVANSYSGLYLTGLLVFVAARLGYTIYLHHHVYSYIDDYDWRMAWIVRQMGPRDVHVVHEEKMVADFRNRYPTRSEFLTLYPSIVVTEVGHSRNAARRPFRLGLLSSMSAAKGLSDVLETFVTLAERARDVTLTLAGPIPTRDSKQRIDEIISRYPDRARHIGPVYGDDKARFFSEIDAFLFPTKSESWGLVLNEALAAGVPVISFDRGCTQTVVGREAGLLIDRDASFIEPAALQIERWMDDNDVYCQASQAAIAQAQRLQQEGQRRLADFVQHMFSPMAQPVAKG